MRLWINGQKVPAGFSGRNPAGFLVTPNGALTMADIEQQSLQWISLKELLSDDVQSSFILR